MGVMIDYKNLKLVDLDTVYITGGGFIRYPFKGIARDSALGWQEAVWGNLTRSKNLVLTNIDTTSFGLVARVELNFKFMNLKDYEVLMLLTQQRVVTVDYVSRETGLRVTQEMSFTKNSLKSIYGFGNKFIGVQDVSISLVATNRDKVDLISSNITITYNNNGGSGSIAGTNSYWGDMIKLSSNEDDTMTKSGNHIKEWNTKADGSGASYGLGQNITTWKDLELFAIWESA